MRNQIASIRLLTEHQIVDNERRFDQDSWCFAKSRRKCWRWRWAYAGACLLGKKEFTVDLQPVDRTEFLKAYYTNNQIPREILLTRPAWQEPSEAALEEFLSSKRLAPVSLTVPRRGRQVGLVRLAEKNLESILDLDSALVDLQNNLNLPSCPGYRMLRYQQPRHRTCRLRHGIYKDAKPDKRITVNSKSKPSQAKTTSQP